MEVSAEDGKVYIHQGGDCIEVDPQNVASMVGRLVRAALLAQHQQALLEQ